MNVYNITTTHNHSQTHCVIAENMAEAERVFLGKYWPTTIEKIELHSEYVQIQQFDEQKRNDDEKAKN